MITSYWFFTSLLFLIVVQVYILCDVFCIIPFRHHKCHSCSFSSALHFSCSRLSCSLMIYLPPCILEWSRRSSHLWVVLWPSRLHPFPGWYWFIFIPLNVFALVLRWFSTRITQRLHPSVLPTDFLCKTLWPTKVKVENTKSFKINRLPTADCVETDRSLYQNSLPRSLCFLHQATDNECTLSTNQRPDEPCQSNNSVAPQTICHQTSDRLGPIPTASNVRLQQASTSLYGYASI